MIRKKVVFGAVATVALVLGTAVALLSPASSLTNCSVSGGEQAIDAEEAQMLDLVNEYRLRNGRSPLSLDPAPSRAAAWFSRDMADKNYFPDSHVDSLGRNPGTRLTQCDAPWTAYAENIAAGNATAEATFEQWRNSPSHDATMLRTEVHFAGIGRAVNTSSTFDWYWTLDLTAGQASATTTSTPSTVLPTTTPNSTSSTTTTSSTSPSTTSTLPGLLTTIVTLPGTTGTTSSTLPSLSTTTTTSPTSTTTTLPPTSDATCAQLATQQAGFNLSIDGGEERVRASLSGAQETAALDQLARQRDAGNAQFTALQADCDPLVLAEAERDAG